MRDQSDDVIADLASIGREFYARGWVLGTSGNFSSVLSRDPLRLAITASGVHKGELGADCILEIDEAGRVIYGSKKPSAETLLHLTIARVLKAGAVLHTHSVWTNILSSIHQSRGILEITGHEMLKGLEGVTTHLHRESVAIVENSQDMTELAAVVEALLEKQRSAHGFLIARHGLYTWGRDLAEARRHVEIFEYLFEVTGRTELAKGL